MTHGSALWLEMVAMGPLILDLTGSKAQLGVILMMRTVASMAMGPVAGVVADAFKRKTILIVTKFPVMVLSAIFAVLLITGRLEVWHLYTFTLFRGVTQAFDQPARNAMIPSIVPSNLVTNAVALNTGSQSATRIVGPAVGGVVIALWGLGAAFVGIALLYVVAVVFTFMLRVPDHRRPGSRVHVGNFGSDFVQGMRYALSTSTVLGLIIISMVYHTFGMNYLAIFGTIYSIEILDIGTRGLGFLFSSAGVGGIVGAFTLATFNPSRRRGLIMMGVLCIYGIALMAYAGSASAGSVVMVYGMAAALGFLQTWMLPLIHSITLNIVPEDMRGRVMGLLALDRGMSAGGGAVAGFLAAAIYPPLAQVFLGLACLLSALLLLATIPALRRIQ
jgi:MFS family permease